MTPEIDIGEMNELALFAGAGGGILGGHLLGWRTVVAVERDAYAAQVLAQRQNDGCLRPFPIWSDVTTFDGRPWRGIIDVVSGGFPCQDISKAGSGKGIDGSRSGLWREMARIVDEVRPKFVFLENSPLLVRRGLALVIGDLTELGYDSSWGIIGADSTGAPHSRKRLWLVANANSRGCEAQRLGEGLGIVHRDKADDPMSLAESSRSSRWPRWPTEPRVARVADGLGVWVDQSTALGNGQVPRVVAAAWKALTR